MEDESHTRRRFLTTGFAAGLALGTGVMTSAAWAQSAPAGMRGIVDAQAYASDVWYLPVESLLGEMQRAGVERAVLVQYDGEIDNDYQFDAVRRYPGRFANVVAVNYGNSDAPATLAALAGMGASGVRIPANVHSPTRWQSGKPRPISPSPSPSPVRPPITRATGSGRSSKR